MRGEVGVLVSLGKDSGQTTRLVFDDVSRQSVADATTWDHRALFTVADYSTEQFEQLALSKDDFARIGENVVIRLLALTGRLKNGA